MIRQVADFCRDGGRGTAWSRDGMGSAMGNYNEQIARNQNVAFG